MRNLAVCGLRRAHGTTVRPSDQFVPVTRPLSLTGEREQCSVFVGGGDASAWPPLCLIVDYRHRKTIGVLKPWGDWSREDFAQRGRPAVPDHWTGRPGGSGAQPPLHLIHMVKVGRKISVWSILSVSFACKGWKESLETSGKERYTRLCVALTFN